MNCPYCGQEMKTGRLRSVADRAVFWFPDHSDCRQWVLSKKKIEDCGGVVLDTVSNVGFFAAARPESYWCSSCKVCITKK